MDDAVEEAQGLRSAAEYVFQRMGVLGGPWNIGPIDVLPRADLAVVAGDSELMAHVRVKNMMVRLYVRELLLLREEGNRVTGLIEANRR